MPYLDGRPITGINSFGYQVAEVQNSDYLFANKWTAKVPAIPGEGLQNNAGTGWVGGVSQVTEHTKDPAPDIWQQTSLLNYQLEHKLIKDKLPVTHETKEISQPMGHQAVFYPAPLQLDYGNWITQGYASGKGISTFKDLGNYTYEGTKHIPPTNLSQEKTGSTLAGLKEKGIIKQ